MTSEDYETIKAVLQEALAKMAVIANGNLEEIRCQPDCRRPYEVADAFKIDEHEIPAYLLACARRNIRDIKVAFEKIRKGLHGICEICQGQIAPIRLKTMPWARFCVQCQNNIEIEEKNAKLCKRRNPA